MEMTFKFTLKLKAEEFNFSLVADELTFYGAAKVVRLP
jgi:hypothetical protein